MESKTFGSIADKFGPFQLLVTKSYCGPLNALTFQPASIRIVLIKSVQNQHKHGISGVVAILRIHCFLDPKLFGSLQIFSHVIFTIFRFLSYPNYLSSQKKLVKKTEPNIYLITRICRICTNKTSVGSPRGKPLCRPSSASHSRRPPQPRQEDASPHPISPPTSDRYEKPTPASSLRPSPPHASLAALFQIPLEP
jgi:hypothetical protein